MILPLIENISQVWPYFFLLVNKHLKVEKKNSEKCFTSKQMEHNNLNNNL